MAHANARLNHHGRQLLIERVVGGVGPSPTPRKRWESHAGAPTAGFTAGTPRARLGRPRATLTPTQKHMRLFQRGAQEPRGGRASLYSSRRSRSRGGTWPLSNCCEADDGDPPPVVDIVGELRHSVVCRGRGWRADGDPRARAPEEQTAPSLQVWQRWSPGRGASRAAERLFDQAVVFEVGGAQATSVRSALQTARSDIAVLRRLKEPPRAVRAAAPGSLGLPVLSLRLATATSAAGSSTACSRHRRAPYDPRYLPVPWSD